MSGDAAKPGFDGRPVAASAPPGEWLVLAVALGLPTLATWLYFVVFAGRPGMMPVYTVSKVIQFSIPLVWAWRTGTLPSPWIRPRGGELVMGIASGLAMAAIIAGAVVVTVSGSELAPVLHARLSDKLTGAGFATPGRFLMMAVFYSLAHSALEEYYWRWFVFGRLDTRWPLAASLAVSSLGFMAHHVIVVTQFVGATSLAWSASAGVAVAGALWALMLRYWGTLWASWASHLLVDAALMSVGAWLLWGDLGTP